MKASASLLFSVCVLASSALAQVSEPGREFGADDLKDDVAAATVIEILIRGDRS